MRTKRLFGITFAATAVALFNAAPVDAQLRGRVAVGAGPLDVDVVLGPRPSARVRYRSGPVYDRSPVRYRRGMRLGELEYYLEWVEREYRHYKRIDDDEAWYYLGWTEDQLEDYVDWLKDERKFLKKERKRLRKHYRDGRRYDLGSRPYDWDDDDWDDDDWDDRRERPGRRGRGGRGR